ncbi:MAG: oxidoreductase [Lapillicoccus sp.]
MKVARVVAVAAGAVLAALTLTGSSLPVVKPPPRAVTPDLAWHLTPTGSAARLRGLSAVSGSVAWVSGSEGSQGAVLRTVDAGATWASVAPPGAEGLDLRDVQATSATHAVVLSVGSGPASRIYVTDDGGATWAESFRNTDERAYYDCLTFSTPQRGLALSDPVDGAFRLLETSDGGRSWTPVNPDGMPAALPNEFAFAASGTCLTAGQDQTTYLGSGGQAPARVFTSRNRGHTWSVTEVPVVGGPSAGVFSVRFRDRLTGVAVGGDLSNPFTGLGSAAWTADGATWQVAEPAPGGYRSGSAWLPQAADVVVAVGPTGSDVSVDAGRRWAPVSAEDPGGFDSLDCAADGACWASGEQGRVARLLVDGR